MARFAHVCKVCKLPRPCPDRQFVVQKPATVDESKSWTFIADTRAKYSPFRINRLALLPTELRIAIYDQVYAEREIILVQPGYIPRAIRNSRLNVGEMMVAWLRSNIFRLESKLAVSMLERMLRTFELKTHLKHVS